MRPYEKRILNERLENFVNDLYPVDLLPYLRCLTEPDKEKIKCDGRNDGESRATQTLVDRLKKRGHDAFSEFVRALRETGSDHVAMLLDPLYRVEQNPESDECIKESPCRSVLILGTAIGALFSSAGAITCSFRGGSKRTSGEARKFRDIKITARVNDGNGHILHDLEDSIAKAFEKPSSQQSRELRMRFAEKLPQGATFVHTKKGSVVSYFRLSKVDAADKLWEMYRNQEFGSLLTEMFITDEIRGKVSDKELKLEVSFVKDILTDAKQKLEAIESGQLSRATHFLGIEGCEGNEDLVLQEDLPEFEIPPVHLDKGQGPQALDLYLRKYQEELSQKALEGYNTIICAPTNSGKTYVALNIARSHLEKMDGKRKVIFVVSTVNLVLQQKERFELYLVDKYTIKDISGANACDIPLDSLIKNSEVVVLTAQILVNALKDGSLTLHDISLLVFDECHHTNKDHPYNRIMEHYMTLRLQPGRRRPLPQIVGLTASLGVGKARKTTEAEEHILEVCANLDAAYISTVRENKEELNEHISTPTRTVHPVARNKLDVFDCIIGQAMDSIETFVKQTPLATELPPTGRSSQQYRHWCETLYTQGVKSQSRYIVTYAEQLREYHVALTINEATRMKDAMLHLQKYFEYLDVNLFTNIDKQLKRIYLKAVEAIEKGVLRNGDPQNPKLGKLQELLLKYHAEDSNEDSTVKAKGILFSATRESTMALENWINETKELNTVLMPLRLVGTREGEGGMTQNDQEEVIQKFRIGHECNIIIATTVAEEGLDITDCSYVIRYDMMGNEISSVQSRGRVRTKEGGHFSVVVGSTSGALMKEERNMYRECLMEEALARVQNMDPEQYKNKVKGFQKVAAKDREMKAITRRGLKSQYDPSDVTLKCRKCHVIACQAHDVRRIRESYHVVIVDEFLDLIIEEEMPESQVKKFDGLIMSKRIKCAKCGEHWGVTVNIKGLDMPCIKIMQFVVEMLKDGKHITETFKQWKKCPFEIESIEFSDLLEMKL